MKLTQILNFNKSTKGTHQFTTQDPLAVTTSIYIRKEKMPVAPKSVTITVEFEDG